jgi:hypothetical protein
MAFIVIYDANVLYPNTLRDGRGRPGPAGKGWVGRVCSGLAGEMMLAVAGSNSYHDDL